MSNFSLVLKESGVDNLHKVTCKDDKKYLCFTKVCDKKTLTIVVFDGIEMWLDEHNEDSLEALKDINGIKSSDAFFLNLRKSISSGNFTVAKVGAKVTLSLCSGDSNLDMDLYEAKAAEKKTWTHCIMFRLAEQCETLESDLGKAKQQIDNLKTQKQSNSGMNALMDFGPKSSSSSNKPKPTKVGMSAINPSSRKRKAASGVVFGED